MVLNAYSDSARDATLWCEISFNPQRVDKMRKRLFRRGYVMWCIQGIGSTSVYERVGRPRY